MTREELIAALETATADQQDECVRRSLRLAVAHGWISVETCERAMRMCDAEAYESAALVLVPDELSVMWFRITSPAGYVNMQGKRGKGATAAIGFCIAALKAQGGGA